MTAGAASFTAATAAFNTSIRSPLSCVTAIFADQPVFQKAYLGHLHEQPNQKKQQRGYRYCPGAANGRTLRSYAVFVASRQMRHTRYLTVVRQGMNRRLVNIHF